MTSIEIAAMPVLEKLRLMESLWESLSTTTQGSFESPSWHADALQAAQDKVITGQAHFVDWESAKAQLRMPQNP